MSNQKSNIKIKDIKPLGCINCASFETQWIPVYKNHELIETILICEKCGHNERLKQKAFEVLFKAWLINKLPKFTLN